jgi:4-amino-4-deoxy-L-arabinose transferase-like glycosyltransferase
MMISLLQRRTASARKLHARVLLALALLWGAFVLANYYTQLWQLLLAGRWERPRFYGDWTLPYLSEAMGRAASGVAGAGWLLASAAVLGLLLSGVAGWRYRNWREGLPFVVSLGAGGLAYIGLGLAAVGLYRAETLRWLAFILVLVGVGWWLVRGRPLPQRPAISMRIRPRVAWLWLGCAALAVSFAFIAALAPEREYDALWYHLAYPRLFLEHGRLIDLPTDYVSLYPMTWELWFGYGLAAGGQTAATLLHFACLPLTAILTFELARRFVPGASPWLSVALFATIPTVMWEASTAYIDLALAFHCTLVIYALLVYAERRQPQWLVLAGLNLGLALATKHLALFVLGLTCAGLVIWRWRQEHALWRALRPALALCGLSLLIALPWYLRSAAATGNPFFPELYQVLGAPAQRWDAATDQGLERFLDHFGQPRTLGNFIILPWNMTIHAASYDGALGPLFLALLPSMGLARWKRALPSLTALLVAFVAAWASPVSSFQMRFVMTIAPILAVLGAVAFARLVALARTVSRRLVPGALVGGLGLLLALNLPPFTPLHEHDRVGWEGWLNSVLHGVPLGVVVGAESREAYLTRTVSSYGVWSLANRVLPQDALVLTWSGGDQFYSRRDRIWAQAAVMGATVWAEAGSEDQVRQALRERGITHLIVDRRWPEFAEGQNQYAILGPTARATWYNVLYEDRYYTLYELR